MERKFWLPISAAITFIGGIAIAFGVNNLALAVAGAFLIFVGMDFFVPITYTWVTESFQHAQELQDLPWQTGWVISAEASDS